MIKRCGVGKRLFIGLCFLCMFCMKCYAYPEIIIDGQVVQGTDCRQDLLNAAAQLNAAMLSDLSQGLVWEYHNGDNCSMSWYRAQPNNQRNTNCALFVSWCMQVAGLIPDGWTFFGAGDGTLKGVGDVQGTLGQHCTLYHIGGRSVGELMSTGELQAGDVVTYVGLQHTNIYAGNGYWYDGGHAFCNGSGEGARFTAWYGPKDYTWAKAAWIIRPWSDGISVQTIQPDIVIEPINDIVITPPVEKEDFWKDFVVVAYECGRRDDVDAIITELGERGFGSFCVPYGGKQYVIAGGYDTEIEASVKIDALKNNGYDAHMMYSD